MSIPHWLVLALACAPLVAGCMESSRHRSHDTGVPSLGDAGVHPASDGSIRATDGSHAQPDAVVVPWTDAGNHDAAPTHVDASASRLDAATSADAAAAIDAAWPMLDIGAADAQVVTGATRCWEGATVTASGVFVGTTCGAIDLVPASCGRPGAPERYFTALGPEAGGYAAYVVEVDPPEFVIQELTPTEVGFDCATIAGACSAAHRVLNGSDVTQFMVERGTGGCGEFTLTVSAM